MLSGFAFRDGVLNAEGVALPELAAEFGTPCYVYSRQAIESRWRAFDAALAPRRRLVCYAVKANANLAVLNILARLGSGFDIVSAGEVQRVIRAGGAPGKVVFSGVGKRPDEMAFALEQGIKCFNVESASELIQLNAVAADLHKTAPVSLRVNPDIDAETHPHISTGLRENKFGVAFELAPALYQEAAALEHIAVVGMDCHIGSQIISLQPFREALQRLLGLLERIEASGIKLQHIDVGGGLGIRYRDETPPAAEEYARMIAECLAGVTHEIILEPGRAIVGNAGILLTRVLYLNASPWRNFAVVDAAMNDLIRPALYDGWHEIRPVIEESDAAEIVYDVVGPICETADFLAKARPLRLRQGDLLAVCSAGAYGFIMASNYNSRPRGAEVIVDGDQVHEVRRRETIADLMRGERLLPA